MRKAKIPPTTRLNLVAALLVTLSLTASGTAVGAAETLTIEPGVPILVPDDAPAPVRRAVSDLQRDLHKVLGEPSKAYASFNQAPAGPCLLVATGPDAWPGVPLSDRVTGLESHGVYRRQVHDRPCVILHGADTRGTIYAIYAFSERYLRVQPLWYWASLEPAPQPAIEIPADGNLFFAAPQVRWRAWFLNDDHRLQAWFRRDGAHLDALGEAMLRLKLNTVELYQFGPRGGPSKPYQVIPEVHMAARYGLVISSTHISPFGSVYGHGLRDWKAYWRNIRKQDPPPLSMKDTTAMKDFWRYHIETVLHHDLEAVWTIAFRGHTDAPFWKSVADVPQTNEERMTITERMWADQIALLRETTGEANPPMRIIFYHELSESLAHGELELPRAPSLIWNFVAARRDHFPARDVRTMTIPPNQLVGYYMNLQFTSTGSHYAAGESPWKMERNFRMIDELSPTGIRFAVVNAGNVREHLMELSAYAAMTWDFGGYDSDRFLERYCARYFDPAHAEAVAALYRDYYDAYWQQRRPDLPGFKRQYIFQDYRLARSIMVLTKRLAAKPDARRDLNPFRGGDWFRIEPAQYQQDSQLDALIQGMDTSVQDLTAVTRRADALLGELPAASRSFFNDNLRVQAYYLLHLSDAVRHLARTLRSRLDGQLSAARDQLQQAKQAARAMVACLAETEHSPFESWYDERSSMGPKSRLDEVLRTELKAP